MRKFLCAAALAVATIGVAAAPAVHADPPFNTDWGGGVCVRGVKASATLNAAHTGYVLSGPGRFLLDDFGVTQPAEVQPDLWFQFATAQSKAHTTITASFARVINVSDSSTRSAEGSRYLLPYSIDADFVAQDNGFDASAISFIVQRYSVCVALGPDVPPPS